MKPRPAVSSIAMLLRYISVLDVAPAAFFVLIAAFALSMLLGLAFHEFCHAYVADSLGDPTPRRAGRLTLNPRAHLDPVGSLLIFFVGFGWAKPTPVNPYNTRHPRQAMAVIAAAGPVSNLVVAGLAGLVFKTGVLQFDSAFTAFPTEVAAQAGSASYLAGLFLGTVLMLNVFLAVFNLLPIAPLDGFRVAVGVLPREIAEPVARLEPWGFGILMLLFFLPLMTGGQVNVLGQVMSPLITFFLNLFVGDAGGVHFA